MCEKRCRKFKRGSQITRLREARRMQRLQRLTIATPLPTAEIARPPCPPHPAHPILMDKALQNRVLLELAWKTVMLMQKNKIIQQKIVDLQKETSEFVAKIMNNPENKKRYIENLRLHSLHSQQKLLENKTMTLKLEMDG